jgi:23S rRNA-/tRNA-specific pseudouridylate synthase
VINKPRDLVVHPGAGNPDGTVLNALLHYWKRASSSISTSIAMRSPPSTFSFGLSPMVPLTNTARFQPQDIPLNIVYEDDDIIVINKPRDLVVHPGAHR